MKKLLPIFCRNLAGVSEGCGKYSSIYKKIKYWKLEEYYILKDFSTILKFTKEELANAPIGVKYFIRERKFKRK